MDIMYHRAKLEDDPHGITMDEDAIEAWVKSCRTKGLINQIPSGYVDRIDDVLILIKEHSFNSRLHRHLRKLLGYYLDDIFREMESRGIKVE